MRFGLKQIGCGVHSQAITVDESYFAEVLRMGELWIVESVALNKEGTETHVFIKTMKGTLFHVLCAGRNAGSIIPFCHHRKHGLIDHSLLLSK